MNNVIYYKNEEDKPEKYYKGDAGIDLKATKSIKLLPFEVMTLDTNISVDFREDTFGYITGRSSYNKKGIMCLQGTIDTGYRGFIKVNLVNITSDPKIINKGDRIAQLVLIKKDNNVYFEKGQADDNTDRGNHGFGSTGK